MLLVGVEWEMAELMVSESAFYYVSESCGLNEPLNQTPLHLMVYSVSGTFLLLQ